MRLTGRILVIIVTVIIAVAALFCIIGLASKGWSSGGLFCDGCSKTPAALSVISFILLIVTLVAFAVLMFDILQGFLRFIPFVLLFVATIFLLSTFASYITITSSAGYSYNLMVVAHFFSYIALAIAAYWYGQSDATSSSTG